MKNVIHKINELFAVVCGYLLVVLMLFLVVDLICRVLNRPIQGANELAIFTLVAVVYLGIPNCESNRKHIKIDVLTKRLPQKIRQYFFSSVYFLSFFFLIFIVYSAGRSFIYAYETKEALSGTINLILWPIKMAIFIGLLFYFSQVFINTIDEFKKLIYILKHEQD